jgi:hypothetical protein
VLEILAPEETRLDCRLAKLLRVVATLGVGGAAGACTVVVAMVSLTSSASLYASKA